MILTDDASVLNLIGWLWVIPRGRLALRLLAPGVAGDAPTGSPDMHHKAA